MQIKEKGKKKDKGKRYPLGEFEGDKEKDEGRKENRERRKVQTW